MDMLNNKSTIPGMNDTKGQGSSFAMSLANISSTIHNGTNETEMPTVTDFDWLKYEAFEERLLLTEKIVLIFIAIFTILGNTWVLVATWRERSLHQPNKYFIAFLAVADLLVGVFVAPLLCYALHFYHQSAYSVSIHLCRFMVWIDTFASTTSIHILTFISFDRYFKISKPFQYKSRMTTSTIMKAIFVITFISTAFATYAATPHSGSHGLLETSSSACPDAEDDKAKIFETFLSISAFCLPTLIMLIMYVLIFFVAHKRQKKILNGELGQTFSVQKQRTAFRQDMKVIRMLVVVVGVFIFCWGPWITWILLWYYGQNYIDWGSNSLSYWYRIDTIAFISRTLPLFNSMCNPIIYAWLDQTYKEAFKRLFQRMMCRPNSTIGRQPPAPIELRTSSETKSGNLITRTFVGMHN